MTVLSPRFKKAYDVLLGVLSDSGVLEGSSVEIAALLGLGSPRALRRALLAFEPLGVKRTNTYGQAVRIESGQSGHSRPARAATRAASPARAATGGLGGVFSQVQEETAAARETTAAGERPESGQSGQSGHEINMDLLARLVEAVEENAVLRAELGRRPSGLAPLAHPVSLTKTEGGASCNRPETVPCLASGNEGRAQDVGPGPRVPPHTRHTPAVVKEPTHEARVDQPPAHPLPVLRELRSGEARGSQQGQLLPGPSARLAAQQDTTLHRDVKPDNVTPEEERCVQVRFRAEIKKKGELTNPARLRQLVIQDVRADAETKRLLLAQADAYDARQQEGVREAARMKAGSSVVAQDAAFLREQLEKQRKERVRA